MLEIGFDATLTGNGDTKTMVLAIAGLDARTGKPAQPVSDGASPLVHASEIEEAEIV